MAGMKMSTPTSARMGPVAMKGMREKSGDRKHAAKKKSEHTMAVTPATSGPAAARRSV
jgi:hypothetical protein